MSAPRQEQAGTEAGGASRAARCRAEGALRRELAACQEVREALTRQRQAAVARDHAGLSAATAEVEARADSLSTASRARQEAWAKAWGDNRGPPSLGELLRGMGPVEALRWQKLWREAAQERRRLQAAAEVTAQVLGDGLAYHQACLAVLAELTQGSYGALEGGPRDGNRRCLFVDEAA